MLVASFLLILYVCSPILPDFCQSLPATRKFYFLDVQLIFCLVCLLFGFFFIYNGDSQQYKMRYGVHLVHPLIWDQDSCPFVLLLPWNKAHFSESAKYLSIYPLLSTCKIVLLLLFFFLLVN